MNCMRLGVVEYLDEGNERLYTISADQHHNAAYYRNTAIHYFILDAFVEICLLSAAAEDENQLDAFHKHATALRELFKFEFYLPRTADYRAEIESKLRDRFEYAESILEGGEATAKEALHVTQPLVAHGSLRSFADAYRVVAVVLAGHGADAVDDEGDFVGQCLKTGKQQLLQGRVFSAESVSKSLYSTAYKLADYRGLLDANKAEERQDLLIELRGLIKRLDDILGIILARADDD